ncbi:hypothetical protein POTOM_060495 [Populus tomentosa]|uniref:Uncharacterized protein n=1 Tax=Populus tomentosa TaxID=118781 RepID=A0A8X7XQG4_POPTO|nr:hypothetical protein POTOM_060495 [Populus tomentosa]
MGCAGLCYFRDPFRGFGFRFVLDSMAVNWRPWRIYSKSTAPLLYRFFFLVSMFRLRLSGSLPENGHISYKVLSGHIVSFSLSICMDDCCISSFQCLSCGKLVNCNIESGYNWSGCNHGWNCSSIGILFNHALVENTMAKFKSRLLFFFCWLLPCSVHMNYVLYVTAGKNASERYSPSGFFLVYQQLLWHYMLFICRMVFNGNGLDVDEYVRRDTNLLIVMYRNGSFHAHQSHLNPMNYTLGNPVGKPYAQALFVWASHLGLLYFGSLVVLLVYSILYGLTATEARWLGFITSAAVIILDWNMGACLYGFQLLQSRVGHFLLRAHPEFFFSALGCITGLYLGHCISYAIVASVLLGAAVSRHLSVTNPLAARRDALQSTVIRLREGFRRKEQNTSSSSSEGCGSSVKRSSSIEAGPLGNIVDSGNQSAVQCTTDSSNWNNVLCRMLVVMRGSTVIKAQTGKAEFSIT